MNEKLNKNQQEYWDGLHKKGKRASEVEGVPNEFAINYMKYIKPGGTVLEIGVASGNDARYFARENQNKIVGVDISAEAIKNFVDAAVKDGTIDKMMPIVANAEEIPKLLNNQECYDAFYSRSALHLDDDKIISFLQWLVSHLNKDGVVMIEGKTKEDFKIKRSIEVGKNLYEDIDGHIRRVWSEDGIKSLCDFLNLEIVEIKKTSETILGEETQFIHFIAKKK
ncbi:MAG: class I SAM-dependent methyltransferase [Candidatus Paceibacterota bacterium]|jgi:cyclopropane fatty-acyl-phospholipid synthase-like methyltransferase